MSTGMTVQGGTERLNRIAKPYQLKRIRNCRSFLHVENETLTSTNREFQTALEWQGHLGTTSVPSTRSTSPGSFTVDEYGSTGRSRC
jgi:hypothetical protein